MQRQHNDNVDKPMNSDCIIRSRVSDGSIVALDLTISDIVGSFTTNEEAITANNGIGSESRSLEDVADTAKMEARLFEVSADKGCFEN